MSQNDEDLGCQVDTHKEEPNRSISETIAVEAKDILRKGKQTLSDILKSKQDLTQKPILPKEVTTLNLQPGERVRIKSVEEIKKTLFDGKLQGCAFTKYMWPSCGKEAVVFKRVNTFLNETNNKVQKISDTVLLENSFCTGERRFGEVCDRACFIFWKEAWLERIE